MDEGPRITCSNCKAELDDLPEGTAAEPSKPKCPTCGATERTYTISVQPGEIKFAKATGRVRLRSRATGHAVSERAVRAVDELATATTVRSIAWHDPNEHGDVLCEVRDGEGNVLGVNVGDDLDDAILNLADQLKPPTET